MLAEERAVRQAERAARRPAHPDDVWETVDLAGNEDRENEPQPSTSSGVTSTTASEARPMASPEEEPPAWTYDDGRVTSSCPEDPFQRSS